MVFRNCLKLHLILVSLTCYAFLLSCRKQVPPSTLNALVNDYNDGFLLNYLDPREHARSFNPLPWALRAAAPTDHNLAQKVETEIDSSKAFTLPKYLNEKHQIAVDASGLEVNQQYYDFGWVKIRRTKMTLLVVFVIGFGLSIGATVLNKTPLDDLPAVPSEVNVTHTNKAPADIDAKKKQALLDFMNEANKSVPSERVTPKKVDLFDFINVNVNIDEKTEDKPKSSFSSKPTPPAEKIVSAETTIQMLKSDSVEQPVVDTERESATLKIKETTPSSSDEATSSEATIAKQKPNILRSVKNLIRSLICAIKNKCE